MKRPERFQVETFLKNRKVRGHIRRVIAIMSAVVLLFTMNTLKRNANTLSRYPMCGYEEHIHDGSCFDEEGNLICLIPEHEHTDACYQQAPDYVPEEEEMDLPVDDEGDDVTDDADDYIEPLEEPVEPLAYTLDAPALLSDIALAMGMELNLNDVIEVGAVENDEAHVGLVLAERLDDGDWWISALREFKDAELALITADDILIIPLIDGVPEAQPEETEVEAEPTEVGDNETESGNEGGEQTEVSTDDGENEQDLADVTDETDDTEDDQDADADADAGDETDADLGGEDDEADIGDDAEPTEGDENENTDNSENDETVTADAGADEGEQSEDGEPADETEGEKSEDGEPTDETEGEKSEDGEPADETEGEKSEDGEPTDETEGEKSEDGEPTDETEEADVEGDETEETDETAEGDETDETEQTDETEETEPAEGGEAVEANEQKLSVSVDLSSVDLMDAASVEADNVKLSVADLLTGADAAVQVEGELSVDNETFVDNANVTAAAENVQVEDGVITLSAEALEAGVVVLELTTTETRPAATEDGIEVETEVQPEAETEGDNTDEGEAQTESEGEPEVPSEEAATETVVTTQIVEIQLTGYTGRTTDEIASDPTVQIVPAEGNSLPADAYANVKQVDVPEELSFDAQPGEPQADETEAEPQADDEPQQAEDAPQADESGESEPIEDQAAATQESTLQDAVAYDITITNDNNDEISDTGAVEVTLFTPNLNVLENVPEGMAASDVSLQLYHVHDDGTTELVQGASFDADEDGNVRSVSFSAESFSTYVVKYTVDFHYIVNGQAFDFAIGGGGYVSFEALAEVLQLAQGEAAELGETELTDGEAADVNGIEVSERTKQFVANIQSLEFSSPELVWVGKVDEATSVGALKAANALQIEYTAEMTEEKIAELDATNVNAGDWALISLQPFDTEETLTVTMVNGDQFTIDVTDGQLHMYVISDAGDLYEVIVTYDDTAEIPDDATLSVTQITADTEHYAENVEKVNEELIARSESGVTDPVQFSISILSGGEVVEPKPGSVVSVEVRLAQAMFQKPEAEEGAEETEEGAGEADEEADEEQKPSILINGVEYTADTDEVEIDFSSCKIAHIADDGTVEIIGETQNTVENDQVIVQFETESFSDYMFQADGNNTPNVLNDLPSIIYVGDEIYMWHLDRYWVTEIGNVVTESKFDPAHVEWSLSGNWQANGDYKVIRAIKTGTFRIYNEDNHNQYKDFEVRNTPTSSKPGVVGLAENNNGIGIVNNADIGLTLNLFDYDLDDYLDNRFNNLDYGVDDQKAVVDAFFAEHGINNGHNLKFWGSGIGGNYGAQNQYVEHGVTSIVENQLVDGYPKLTSANGGDRLDYLFTPSNGTDKKVYLNADKLFRRDENGYYIYDSNTNYAYYDPNQGNNGDFVVYNSEYKQKYFTDENGKKNQINGELGPVTDKAIGFFPFHDWNTAYDLFTNWNKNLNHHFGLSMSVKFALPRAPKAVEDSNGNDIIFEFSGDDDLWVFIDGKLAMDIGGVHQPTSGTINFTTQEVWVNGNRQTGYDFSSLYDGNEHELKVFYIERGGSDSNCKIMFNITQYGDAGFVKKNQINQPLPSALFGLYKDAACTQPLMEHLDAAHNNIWRQFTAESDQRGLVEFHGIPVGTYYMREIQAPDDYPLDPTVHTIKVVAVGHSVQTRVYIDDMTTPVEKGQYGVWGKDIINYPTKYISLDLQKEWKDSTGTNLIDDTASLTATFELKRTATYEKWVKRENDSSYTIQTGTVTNDSFNYSDWNPTDTEVVNNRITLSSSNSWYHKFENLPLNVVDTNDSSITYHYKYYLEEVNVPSGMAVTYRYLNADNEIIDGPVAVNATEIATNKVPTVDIEATKTWKSSVTGESVNATLKNATVTFELQRRTRTNGNWSGWEKVTKNAIGGDIDNPVTVSVTEANAAAWKVTWTKLLKSDDIEYRVIETYAMAGDDELVTDATAEKPQATVSFVSGTGTANIDNTLPTKPVTVQKTWSGSDTWYDSHLQVEVTLHATLNGTNCDATALAGRNDQIVMLTSGQPSYTWADLPVYSDAGDEIEYTVEETALYYKPDDGDAIYLGAAALDAFTTTSTVDANGDITIDNTPKTTEIDVEKEWVGDGNKSQVELYLVRYKKGAPEPPTPVQNHDVTVSINWNGSAPEDGTEVTATVDGKSVTLNAGNGWSGAISDVADGSYTPSFSVQSTGGSVDFGTASTITVNGGDASGSVSATYTPNVTTHDVTVSINWNGSAPEDGTEVTATVDGKSVTLNAGNGWSGTISGVADGSYTPSFSAQNSTDSVDFGTAPTIVVNGANVSGTVSATYTPPTHTVTVSINWNGSAPEDGTTVTATVDGKSVTLNAGNGWSGTISGVADGSYTPSFSAQNSTGSVDFGTAPTIVVNGANASGTVSATYTPSGSSENAFTVQISHWYDDSNSSHELSAPTSGYITFKLTRKSGSWETTTYTLEAANNWKTTIVLEEGVNYQFGIDRDHIDVGNVGNYHYQRISPDYIDNITAGDTATLTGYLIQRSASASLFQMAFDPFVAHADDYNAYGNATSVATVAGGITPPTGYTLDADWGKIIVLNNNSGWSKQVENLPVYDEYGQEYYYAIVEREVPTGFTVTYNPGGTKPTPIAASSYTGTVATLKAINTFIGTYDHPTVTKFLNGKLFEGKLDDGTTVTERFTFNLYDSNNTLLQSVYTDDNGTVQDFNPIEFVAAGTYTYKITEDRVLNSKKFTYDEKEIYWRVSVNMVHGRLVASHKYYSDALCRDEDEITGTVYFDNTELTYLDIYKKWSLDGGVPEYEYPEWMDAGPDSIKIHLYREPSIYGKVRDEINAVDGRPIATGNSQYKLYELKKGEDKVWKCHIDGLEKYYKDSNGEWAEYEYYIEEDEDNLVGWKPVMYKAGQTESPSAINVKVNGGGAITVVNSKYTVRLPSTGGVGTGVIYAAGSGLVLLAAIGWLLAARKRRQRAK